MIEWMDAMAWTEMEIESNRMKSLSARAVTSCFEQVYINLIPCSNVASNRKGPSIYPILSYPILSCPPKYVCYVFIFLFSLGACVSLARSLSSFPQSDPRVTN